MLNVNLVEYTIIIYDQFIRRRQQIQILRPLIIEKKNYLLENKFLSH